MMFSPNARKSTLTILVVVAVLAASTLACSLTEEAPPTLAPRQPMSTTTPQQPIGPQSTIQPPPVPPQLPPQVSEVVPTNPTVANQLLLIDGNRMLNTIIRLVSFDNRHVLGEPAPDKGIYAARDFLLGELYTIRDANPDKRIDVYAQDFQFSYSGIDAVNQNLMMVLTGTDSEAGVVLIGAHYDTISSPSALNASNYQPGANDDGSGVAAVLEIARIMAQTYHRATVIFVFFSAEELDRFGSKAFVQQFVIPQGFDLKAVLSLDIVGSPTGPGGERYDNQMRLYSAPPNDSGSRQLARMVELVSRVYTPEMNVNLEVELDRAGRWGDHQSFSDAQFSAVRLIEQKDDLTRTHNARDSLDDIDGNYLRRVAQVALATMLVMADGPNPPKDWRLDTANWRLEWTPSRGAARYVIALRYPGSTTYNLEMTVADNSLTWDSLRNFETVAVAAIDANGQLGPFSKEWRIPPVPGQ